MRKRIENHPAVDSLDYEGKVDGWWCYLKAGFIDAESGCTAIHAWTLKDVWNKLSYVKKETARHGTSHFTRENKS